MATTKIPIIDKLGRIIPRLVLETNLEKYIPVGVTDTGTTFYIKQQLYRTLTASGTPRILKPARSGRRRHTGHRFVEFDTLLRRRPLSSPSDVDGIIAAVARFHAKIADRNKTLELQRAIVQVKAKEKLVSTKGEYVEAVGTPYTLRNPQDTQQMLDDLRQALLAKYFSDGDSPDLFTELADDIDLVAFKATIVYSQRTAQ